MTGGNSRISERHFIEGPGIVLSFKKSQRNILFMLNKDARGTHRYNQEE